MYSFANEDLKLHQDFTSKTIGNYYSFVNIDNGFYILAYSADKYLSFITKPSRHSFVGRAAHFGFENQRRRH